jgi:hypothetical protein
MDSMPNQDGAGHSGCQIASLPRFAPTGAFLKRIALAKLADITLMSAEFGGDKLLFQPWVSLLIDAGSAVKFLGAYRLSFESEEDSATRPNLCWRRSEWNRNVDHKQLAEATDLRAYLTGDTQISSIIAFTRMAAQPALTGLIERTIAEFSHGVTITAAERPDMPWEALQLDIADDRLIWTIDYSPLIVQSEQVERWSHTWIEFFDKLDPHDAIAPDGDIIVSYRRSLPEMLAAR